MTSLYESPLDELRVVLEQLVGLTAVATQADYGELDATEVRFFAYAVHDRILQANKLFMEGRK